MPAKPRQCAPLVSKCGWAAVDCHLNSWSVFMSVIQACHLALTYSRVSFQRTWCSVFGSETGGRFVSSTRNMVHCSFLFKKFICANHGNYKQREREKNNKKTTTIKHSTFITVTWQTFHLPSWSWPMDISVRYGPPLDGKFISSLADQLNEWKTFDWEIYIYLPLVWPKAKEREF